MKFLHTADWQIGMKANQAGERAEAVRAQRYETVRRIVDLANSQEVEFMLVAGDQFDGQTPSRAELAAVVSALRRATMPVFVIPGNHDPAMREYPYYWNMWRDLNGSQVTTVLEPGVFQLPGDGVLLATPCTMKFSTDDPTAWFASHETAPDKIRIGLAHGSLQLPYLVEAVPGDQRGDYPIALTAASRAGISYLALGHWHGVLHVDDDRSVIKYCGTPEQTKFDEGPCGTVTIVEIERAGSTPRSSEHRVGRYTWYPLDITLIGSSAIEEAANKLLALDDPDNALVRVSYSGISTPSDLERLRNLDEQMRQRFFFYSSEIDVRPRPESRAEWLNAVPAGISRSVASELLDRAEDPMQHHVAMRALEFLVEAAV